MKILILITQVNVLICDSEVYNSGAKSCENNDIVKFTYQNETRVHIIQIITW